ncbi:MAG: PorT family protein [Saprospiraceae bacterium]|nr:PorT family protein [Saprospiraceae bacterium]
MKKMLKLSSVLTIVAMMISGVSNAQHVNIGVKGGLNFYNIDTENSSLYDTKTGIHFGLLGHIHLVRSMALQPELVYSSQGAKYNASGTNNKLNLGYINLPVMLQYMFDNGFRLEAGPQLGFLINAKSEGNPQSVDVKDNFKKIDFAVGLGAGYIKPSTGLGFGLRYNAGLSNINENNSVNSTNNGFQLSLFYQFDHK